MEHLGDEIYLKVFSLFNLSTSDDIVKKFDVRLHRTIMFHSQARIRAVKNSVANAMRDEH